MKSVPSILEAADERVREAMESLDAVRHYLQDVHKLSQIPQKRPPQPRRGKTKIPKRKAGQPGTRAFRTQGDRANDAPAPFHLESRCPETTVLNAQPAPKGLDFDKGSSRALRRIDLVIVHCSDSGRTTTVEQIHEWHITRPKGPFACIGYHWFIDGKGVVWRGRPLTRIGAHCGGYNTRSVGICMAGTQDPKRAWGGELGFAQEQWEALASLVRWHATPGAGLENYDGRPWQVLGHRDLNPHKDCPNFDVATRLVPLFWEATSPDSNA